MKIALGILLAWALVFTAIGIALGGGSSGALISIGTWIVAAAVIVAVTKVIRARRRRTLL